MAAGIPVIGATYGALGERIRAFGAGWTIDPTDPDGIRVLIERLDRARDELLRVTRQVLLVPLETVADTAWDVTGGIHLNGVRRFVFNFTHVYELPFGKGSKITPTPESNSLRRVSTRLYWSVQNAAASSFPPVHSDCSAIRDVRRSTLINLTNSFCRSIIAPE